MKEIKSLKEFIIILDEEDKDVSRVLAITSFLNRLFLYYIPFFYSVICPMILSSLVHHLFNINPSRELGACINLSMALTLVGLVIFVVIKNLQLKTEFLEESSPTALKTLLHNYISKSPESLFDKETYSVPLSTKIMFTFGLFKKNYKRHQKLFHYKNQIDRIKSTLDLLFNFKNLEKYKEALKDRDAYFEVNEFPYPVTPHTVKENYLQFEKILAENNYKVNFDILEAIVEYQKEKS